MGCLAVSVEYSRADFFTSVFVGLRRTMPPAPPPRFGSEPRASALPPGAVSLLSRNGGADRPPLSRGRRSRQFPALTTGRAARHTPPPSRHHHALIHLSFSITSCTTGAACPTYR